VPASFTVFLCGDVMTGRGVDQILASPGDPRLWEEYVADARDYVRLAEIVSGRIPKPAPTAWIWGDALAELRRIAPDARVINLETAITSRGTPSIGKPVLYRMNPANIGCLRVAQPDVCVLANNHVLDFGRPGLADTVTALQHAGLPAVGAGSSEEQAWRPTATTLASGRLVAYAAGTPSSGVPATWAARDGVPGVAYLPELSDDAVDAMLDRIRQSRRPGDITLVSIHWGANWGYDVPKGQVRFAHRLIDGGVDVIHGHSSHHPRRFEIYRDRLILYGCGDFIDDYEGIGGYEQYRDDLRLAYFASLAPDGRLRHLRMVVFQATRMRLRSAGSHDVAHVARTFAEIGSPVRLEPDGSLLAPMDAHA